MVHGEDLREGVVCSGGVEAVVRFTPFPITETRNLVLRRIGLDDLDDLFEMRRDPRMHLHTDTKPDEALDETKVYIDKTNAGVDAGKWVIWAIGLKGQAKVIGTISIWNLNPERESGELGYGIIPDYQGRGLMKESLLAVADYGFDAMNLKVLEAYTERDNLRSLKLLERCGFAEVDRVDEEGYCNKRTYHMIVYRLESRRRRA